MLQSIYGCYDQPTPSDQNLKSLLNQRLIQYRLLNRIQGHFVYGLERLEALSDDNIKDLSEWYFQDRWSAKIIEMRIPQRRYENHNVLLALNIIWFQQMGDPIRRVSEISKSIDFRALCVEELSSISVLHLTPC